jgi:hypothetical protein
MANASFETFFSKFHGDRASDFYYKVSAAGSRSYYSIISGERVAKKQIDPKFLNDIPMRSSGSTPLDLLEERQEVLKKLETLKQSMIDMEKKLKDLDASIEALSPEAINEAKQQKIRDAARRAEAKQKQKQKFDEFLNRFAQRPGPQEKPAAKPQPQPQVSPTDRLKKYGITDKKSWKVWLIANHPDRPENAHKTETVKEVIAAGRAMGW